MKFIGRRKEIESLEECRRLSENKLFSVCIFGLRRIGKTRLILEFLKNKELYFFINKDKSSESLLKEYEETLKSKGIMTALESLKRWDDFFSVLLERYKGAVAFDEFQNFEQVNRAVFGVIQRFIDLNENKKGLLMIFSGSTIGLIKKIFYDEKEPLYGRIKRKLQLAPLSFHEAVEMCRELNIRKIEDIILLYAIFGGFPKYYTSIEDENLKGKKPEEILDKFFFAENAVFEEEVGTILSLEFGKRRGLYYDILEAIANGASRISEISSSLNKKETALTRQIKELTDYFNIINIKNQVIGSKRLMFINHPLMEFWFKFFYKNLSRYKRRDKVLITYIKENLNLYVSKRFEGICEEMLLTSKIVPIELTKIGRQWGKFKGEEGKNAYDIDILALNEETHDILFGECKWKNKINAERVASELDKKTQYIDWNKGNRQESFAVFAKSFSKKVKEFNGRKAYCFDLNDLSRILKDK